MFETAGTKFIKSNKKMVISKALAAISYSSGKIDTKDENYKHVKNILNNVDIIKDELGIKASTEYYEFILNNNERMCIK